MSFLEEALVSTEKLANPSEVQSEPHLSSVVVLGQLVIEQIGLENGIVLSFSDNHSGGGGQALFAHGWFLEPTPSAPLMWEHYRWWLAQITVSAFVSTSLDLHCYWLSASVNVSFRAHLTSMSPLVFLLHPLAPRIVSFDYPPAVEHTISS